MWKALSTQPSTEQELSKTITAELNVLFGAKGKKINAFILNSNSLVSTLENGYHDPSEETPDKNIRRAENFLPHK